EIFCTYDNHSGCLRPYCGQLSLTDKTDFRQPYGASACHTGPEPRRMDTDHSDRWWACCRTTASLLLSRRTRERHTASQDCLCYELRPRSYENCGWKSGDISIVRWFRCESGSRRANGSNLRRNITRYRADVFDTAT